MDRHLVDVFGVMGGVARRSWRERGRGEVSSAEEASIERQLEVLAKPKRKAAKRKAAKR